MKQPSPFNLLDFLSFGLFATVPTIIALIFSFSGPLTTSDGSVVTVPGLLTIWAVVLVFWFIYFKLVYTRAKFIKQFTIKTKYNIMVMPNGYQITKEDVEAEIEIMLAKFKKSPVNAVKALEKGFVWVFYDGHLLGEKYGEPVKLWGFVNVGGDTAWVSYAKSAKEDVPDPTKPIANTAFDHEITHILLTRALGRGKEKEHHEFMKTYKLL